MAALFPLTAISDMFVNMPAGARALAIGEAMAADDTDDPFAVLYNPAAAAGRSTIGFDHSLHDIGTQYSILALTFVTPFGVPFAALRYAFLPNMTYYDALGAAGTRAMQWQGFDIAGGYAYSFGHVRVGAALHGIGSISVDRVLLTYMVDAGAAVSFDFLKIDKNPLQNMTVGLCANAVSHGYDIAGAAAPLPLSVRCGLGYYVLRNRSISLRVMSDAVYYPLDNFWRVLVGIEAGIAELVNIRSGYRYGFFGDFLSAGVGVSLTRFDLPMTIDYAVSTAGFYFDSTIRLDHQVSIVIRL